MTVHNLTTTANETFTDRPGYWSAVETLRIGYRKYAVGGWTREGKGRLVQEGRQVVGPVAYSFQHATVIAARPLPDTRTYVDVRVGDFVSVAGSVYQIEAAPNDNIKLTLALGEKNGCDVDCQCHAGTYSCRDLSTGEWLRGGCNCEA